VVRTQVTNKTEGTTLLAARNNNGGREDERNYTFILKTIQNGKFLFQIIEFNDSVTIKKKM
jgi:hypothetical protein